jgi:pyrimidine operon attenuation protein/uracil phosphoribosyltransferase
LAKNKSSLIMDAKQIKHALSRIAHEILESVDDDDDLAIIGIRSRGDHLAERLAAKIKELDGRQIEVGYMDITLYRDDLLTNPEQPEIKGTEILFTLQDKLVILVDDVLFTGRTIRAALNQLRDYGRAKAVRLAVLIDRGGRELPIRADYVGKNIPTSSDDDVVVNLKEEEEKDSVRLFPGSEKSRPPTEKKKGRRK